MVVSFTEQVRQRQFLKEAVKERVQEIIAGLHIGRPGIGPAECFERSRHFLDALAHDQLAPTRFRATEQVVGLIMPGVGEQHGFLAEIILDLPFLPHCFGERRVARQRLFNAVEQGKPDQVLLR